MGDILKEVLNFIPDKTNISDAVFEGANIVLYTKKKEFFLDNNGLIKSIVDSIKKRVELRPDPSISLDPEKAEDIIEKLLPKDSGLSQIIFDPQRSIVIIETEKPGVSIGKKGEILKQIKEKTFWVPQIKRTPSIRSKLIENIRAVLYENNDYRRKFLHKIGKRIYDGWTKERRSEWIRVTFLGAARHVGRSCILLQTPESKVLLDCGVDIASQDEAFPILDVPEFNLNELDAIILTHAHLDHCLPPNSLVLTENGYKKINDINPGEDLISFDFKNGKYVKSKCTEKTEAKGHVKILRIKTPYSRIKSSPNHRFFTFENLELKELRADELKEGMLLPSNIFEKPKLPKKEVILKTNIKYNLRRKDNINLPSILSKELSEFIGYFSGDGHKSTGFSLRLTDGSTQILEHHKDIIKKVFNFDVVIKHHPDKTKNAFILEINNVKILRFLEENFPEIFKKAKYISIPEKIMHANPDEQKSFIRGFADAEGSVTNIVKICTLSDEMLDNLQYLFSNLGIPSSVKSDHTICLNTYFSINKYYNEIGFSMNYKQERLTNLKKDLGSSKEDFIPISSRDLRNILKDAGMFGRIHNSQRVVDVLIGTGLLDLFRGNISYSTRRTIVKLLELLKERLSILESYKNESNLYALRQYLTISRNQISIDTGMVAHQIQQVEENKRLSEHYVKLLSNYIKERLGISILKTKENIQKITHLLSLNVTWEKITKIEELNNNYPYLVDIETEYGNFITGNLIVHNSGLLPYLFKMGYRGPVYCTLPTRDIASLLALDFIGISQKEAKDPIFSSTDVKEMVKHSIALDYEEVTDITPDIRITLYDAGHTLGSAMVHIHVGNGLHNLLYTGDINYENSNLLHKAITQFPRLETVIMEATYGGKDDNPPTRKQCEDELIDIIKKTMERRGKVLIPVLGVGRAQEIMLIIEKYVRSGEIKNIPVYVQGMVWDVTAIHTAYPDFFNINVKKAIFHKDQNPFLSKVFKHVGSQKEMQEVLEGGPCVILATSGMMTGGASVEYFKALADSNRNTLVLVSYQGPGSLGRRLENGDREIRMNEKETISVKFNVHTLRGFSGHSSRDQLMDFVKMLDPKPKKIILMHGEGSKCLDLASSIHKQFRIETIAPRTLDTVRIR